MRINWPEVCKFFAGVFFVGAIVGAYFYFAKLDAPFFGVTIPHTIIGARAIVHAMLFAICFYVGYLRKTSKPD